MLAMSIWDDHEAEMLWLDGSYPLDMDPSEPGITRGECAQGASTVSQCDDQILSGASSLRTREGRRMSTRPSPTLASPSPTSSTAPLTRPSERMRRLRPRMAGSKSGYARLLGVAVVVMYDCPLRDVANQL